MVITKMNYPHLLFREEDGLPIIARVNFKAIYLIENHLAHGWTAEELVINFPQLTLGEVYATLSWFYDHREEVEDLIKKKSSVAAAQALEDRHRQIQARFVKSGILQPSPENV